MENNSFGSFNNMINYSKANLSELVVSHVKYRILSGELKSGDRLVETDISEALQISRAPVREAIRTLDMQGILSFSPRRGSQVLELTYEDVKEIFSIRIPLEMQVLTIINEKDLLNETDLAYLEALNGEMLEVEGSSQEDQERIYLLNSKDLEFHKFFWNKSASFRRAQILESQFFQLLAAMNKDISTLGSVREKYLEHQRIIACCREKSLTKTLAVFNKHMESYLNATAGL